MKTTIRRDSVPTIGRDAGLTIEILQLMRERHERKMRRRAFWLGALSVVSWSCWLRRIRERRLILTLEELEVKI